MGVKTGVFRGKDGLNEMRRHVLERDRLTLDVAGASDQLASDIHDESLILTTRQRLHVISGGNAGIVAPDEAKGDHADKKQQSASTSQAAQPSRTPSPAVTKLMKKPFHGESAKEA